MIARKYQQEAIAFAVAALTDKHRAVVQLPTGSGKSLVLLRIAEKWRKTGKPVYVIAPTDQAVGQLHKTARNLGLFACLDTQENRAPKSAGLIITTYSCAWRRYKRRIHPDTLCLLDECHHINFEAPVNLAILNAFQAAIGLSATPWSRGCASYFDKKFYRYGLSQAINDGVICQFEVVPWTEPVKGQYQIIYTNNGQYRAELCSKIAQSDYAIYKRSISKNVIERFRRGAVGTIIVDRMLTEGFDLPQIKSVWLARQSRSKIALMQMAGRALRPHGGKRAKIYTLNSEVNNRLNLAIQKAG